MNKKSMIAGISSVCIVAAIGLFGSSVLDQPSPLYNFLTEEELLAATATMDPETLRNSDFVVNGIIYKYNSDNSEWENTGVPSSVPEVNGQDGADGLSAYEVLVNNGYTGTEEDFNNYLGSLGSNDASSAYEEFVAKGYAGTEEEFLASLSVRGETGAAGKDGKNGKNGLDGKNGRDGKDGIDGEDGIDGQDGQDGKDGTEITIGEDGFFYCNGIKSGIRADQNLLDRLNISEDGRTEWTELDLIQQNIETRYQDGYIQIKLSEAEEWTNLLPTAEIQGDYWIPVDIINHPACDSSVGPSSTALLKSSYITAYDNASAWSDLLALQAAGALEITDPVNYNFNTDTDERSITLTSVSGDTDVVPVLNTSSYIENDTLMTYSVTDNAFLSSVALLGTDGTNAWQVGEIKDEIPLTDTTGGWIQMVADTYTSTGNYSVHEGRTFYEYDGETTFIHCDSCGKSLGYVEVSGCNITNSSWSNSKSKTIDCSCGGSGSGTASTSLSGSHVDLYIIVNGKTVDIDNDYGRDEYEYTSKIQCCAVTCDDVQKANLEAEGLNPECLFSENYKQYIGKYIYCGIPE